MNQGIEIAMVVLALASPFLIAVFVKHYFQYRSETAHKLAELDLKIAVNENEILKKQMLELRSRVEVLEAIVTDEGYTLRKKIANL
jgi:cell division protein FtsB